MPQVWGLRRNSINNTNTNKVPALLLSGYIHYLANPTCGASQALATVPAADGGSYGALGGVFALPENILLGAVPFVDKNALPGLRKAVADSGVMYVDAFCAAKCADLARGSGLSRADSDRRAL